jgi:hypothetical protein
MSTKLEEAAEAYAKAREWASKCDASEREAFALWERGPGSDEDALNRLYEAGCIYRDAANDLRKAGDLLQDAAEQHAKGAKR